MEKEKQFVPFNLSVKLKEIGFNDSCLAIYSNANHKTGLYTLKDYKLVTIKQSSQKEKGIKAPLYQQAFRWFRERYNLYHSIDPIGYSMCLGKVGELGNLASCNVPNYGTYEEAELACLDKLIEIVETKLK